MAKKTINKKVDDTKPSYWALFKAFFTNERTRFITGLVCAIVTIYIGLALISFFFTGAADQSKIENVPVTDLLTNQGSVENWTGVRGAFLADLLMNRWFGISSFMILFFLGSVGAKLMNIKQISLLKRFIFCLATLIWGSWFFAFFFISGYEDTFIYLGGQHGYYTTEILKNNIGIPGTFLLLVGFFLIIAIFSSKRTIPFLQRAFSFSWIGNIHWKRKKQPVATEPAPEKPVVEEEESSPVMDVEQPSPEYVFDTEKEIEKAEQEAASAVVEAEADEKPEYVYNNVEEV